MKNFLLGSCMAVLGLLGLSVAGVQQAAAAVIPVTPPLASNISIETSMPGFSAPGFEMSLPALAGSFPLDDDEEDEKKPWYKRAWFRVACVAGAVAAGIISGKVSAAAAGIAACAYISSG